MPCKTFLGRLKVKVTGVNQMSKWLYTWIELVLNITCTFMHAFQNNFVQLLPSKRKNTI